MPITVACICGKQFEVPDSFSGRKGKCVVCDAPIRVPGRTAQSATSAQLSAFSSSRVSRADESGIETESSVEDPDDERAASEDLVVEVPAEPTASAGPAASSGSVRPPPDEVTIERTVGGYELVRKLGGPKSSVFLARAPGGKQVALKVIPHAVIAKTPDVGKRFLRGAQSVFGLKHENVATCLDTGEELGNYYLAMELFPGRSLQDVLEASGGKLQEDRVLGIVLQLARGLGHLHRHGLVHRNIKPEHILVGDEGQVKLIGTGLIRRNPDEEKKGGIAPITDGIRVGTPPFMSPEQARGDDVDGRSDLFSLGTTIFLMLTGELPFEATLRTQVLEKLVKEPAPRVSDKSSEVSAATTAVVEKLLEKDPEYRYATAQDLLTDVEAIQAGQVGDDGIPPTIARDAREGHVRPASDRLPVMKDVAPAPGGGPAVSTAATIDAGAQARIEANEALVRKLMMLVVALVVVLLVVVGVLVSVVVGRGGGG